MVSKTVAVTVGIMLCVNVLATLISRKRSKPAKKIVDEEEEEEEEARRTRLRSWCTRIPAEVKYATGALLVLAAARGLRAAGVLARPGHAVLPALLLAFVAHKMPLRFEESEDLLTTDGDTSKMDEICPVPDSSDADWYPANDPDEAAFWKELGDAQALESEEVAPTSDEICADMYLKRVLFR